MKQIRQRIILLILVSLYFPALHAQIIFQEDFDQIPGPTLGGPGTYLFAPGFLLRNVDGGTPVAGVSYVNEAWERREDFANNVADSASFSTSWTTPASTANDWMWTPLIGPIPANTVLKWNAVTYDASYPDGYEVRIMTSAGGPPTGGTGVIGNQITNSTSVFSIAAEDITWTARSISLAAYVGQSIYIAFRNNSTDKFLLLIDDIQVEVITNHDANLTSVDTVSEYTLIPKSQVSPLPLIGDITSSGVLGINNVGMRVNIYDGSMTQIFTNTSATTNIAAAATANFNCGTWTPPAIPDVYTLKFFPILTETDQNSVNDTITRTVVITDTTYARDNGIVTGALGIGAGNGGFLGNEFSINTTARLTSVTTYVTVGYAGEPYAAVVWDMVAGAPNAIIAYTDTLLYPDDSADTYTLPINNGEFLLNPGNYVVTMVEFDSTLQVGLTADIFTLNRTWVDWPTNPNPGWSNNEDFGASFSKAYVVRANLGPECPSDIITGSTTVDAGCGLSDGSGTIVTAGAGPFTYSWSNGGTNATENGLAAGDYYVTVIDNFSGCSEVDTVTIINPNAPIIDSVQINEPLCFGSANGSAQVFVSAGTPGYSYLWSSGGTAALENNLASGSVMITVTDAANCQTQTTINVTEPSALVVSSSATSETCAGCNDGTATATCSGGTGVYTYSWAPSGGTNATATGLTPGIYTVTVTDINGCSNTSSVTVAAFSGIEDAIGLFSTSIYPNPSTGIFNISGNIEYSGDLKIELINAIGGVVYLRTLHVDNQINSSIEVNVAPGTYLVKITAGDHTVAKQLIIK